MTFVTNGERQTSRISLTFTTGYKCEQFLPHVSCVEGEMFILALKTTGSIPMRDKWR